MNLKNNAHLKEVEEALENWDTDKGLLTTNDIQGVDLIVEIEVNKLGLDIPKEKLIALLEDHYEGSDYYFSYNPQSCYELSLSVSSCEEIFVTYDGILCFPDNKSKRIKLSSDNQEVEIIAYTLEWMNNHGYFPGIYQLDYNESPTSFNFYETNEYKALELSENEETQKKEVERLVRIIEFQRYLEENTQTITEIPYEFYEKLPKMLQESSDSVEVLSVDSFTTKAMTLTFEIEELDEEDSKILKELIKKGTVIIKEEQRYQMTINLLPKSINYIHKINKL